MRLRLLFLVPLLALLSAGAQGPQVAVVAPEAPAPIELTPSAPVPLVAPELPPAAPVEAEPTSHEPIGDPSVFTFGDDPSVRLVRLEADAFSSAEMKEWASAVEKCLRVDEEINGVTVTFDLNKEASPVHEYAFELQGFVGEEGWCVGDIFFTEDYVGE